MQQMAGNMGLLNPFVFNQFGSYGTYATQVWNFISYMFSYVRTYDLHTYIYIYKYMSGYFSNENMG